ncbi:MAG TPA: helix-turn-helix transcriptional regulator [Gaiellaceae bacterium]|nr:helix-turn-helix transcriptional regulator [Gaiellaceae bacterium]
MPNEIVSANQLVAYNLRRARQMRGLTQEQAAGLLEPYLGKRWSKATFSAAETSIEGKRVREFSGNDILAFASAFDVTVSWFFLPIDEAPAVMVTCGGPRPLNIGNLLDAFMPYGPKPELTERLETITENVPAGLRGEMDDRVNRFVSQRAAAVIAAHVDSIDQDVNDLRRVADLLELAQAAARQQIPRELEVAGTPQPKEEGSG